MKRLTNALLAFFLPALVCLTVRAVEEPPSWATTAFNKKLSARYELVQKMEPSFFAGDFNGDGRSDVALLIQERTTGKVGIAILESGKNQFKILGAGKSFGNGGEDFSCIRLDTFDPSDLCFAPLTSHFSPHNGVLSLGGQKSLCGIGVG